jgi:hypothetical protein
MKKKKKKKMKKKIRELKKNETLEKFEMRVANKIKKGINREKHKINKGRYY